MEWYVVAPESVSKEGKECWCVEQKYDTDMGATGAQSLESSFSGRNSKHSTKYKCIGDDNKHHIQTSGKQSCNHPIINVDFYAITGQPGNTHVFTV